MAENEPSAAPEVCWLDESENRAWRNWLLLSSRVRSRVARDLLEQSGLSWSDYEVLVHLSEADGHRVRMSELADLLDWSKSRLSHQVARMEKRALVHREECPSDARGAFAVLDDGGLQEIRTAAPAHVASVRRHFIDLLDECDRDSLGNIAGALLEHLGEECGS